MEIKKRQIEVTYYVAFDGKEFSSEEECIHHEAIQRGERKTCDKCNGRKAITRNTDFAGDGNWGSSTGVKIWEEECPKCKGKGYLELKNVWM